MQLSRYECAGIIGPDFYVQGVMQKVIRSRLLRGDMLVGTTKNASYPPLASVSTGIFAQVFSLSTSLLSL